MTGVQTCALPIFIRIFCLIYSVLDEYKDVKQKILISEDKDSSIEFYKNIGFKSIDTYNGVAFVNYIE